MRAFNAGMAMFLLYLFSVTKRLTLSRFAAARTASLQAVETLSLPDPAATDP
jgi:hypothetical protein